MPHNCAALNGVRVIVCETVCVEPCIFPNHVALLLVVLFTTAALFSRGLRCCWGSPPPPCSLPAFVMCVLPLWYTTCLQTAVRGLVGGWHESRGL